MSAHPELPTDPKSADERARVAALTGSEFGPYQLKEIIGQGNIGVVFRALEPARNREVAVKVFAPESYGGLRRDAAQLLFLSDGERARALDHPNIASTLATGWVGQDCYITMEAVYNGRSLHRYCAGTKTPLALDEAVRIVRSCAAALHHAHEDGVLHGDVKPRNILLGVGLQPKLTDFGLSAIVKPRTESGRPTASPRYYAPEQLTGHPPSRQTDLFSLGVILYELITGQHPFPADNPEQAHAKITSARHVPARKIRSDLPRELQTITNRCLAKGPSRRYPTALHIDADLEVVAEILGATKTAQARQATLDQLRGMSGFETFSEAELSEVVSNCPVRNFRPGDEVIAHGDTAACIYLVLDGELGVRHNAFDMSHIAPGEWCGEIGALTNRPRTATVIALDRCRLLTIPTEFLRSGPLACQVQLKTTLLTRLAERIANGGEPIC